MPTVVSVVVGLALAMVVVMFLWSSVKGIRAARLRAPRRPPEAVPDGFVVSKREPEALRAPFAFVLRGTVLDVADCYDGDFRGALVTISDVTARHARGAGATHHTVVTLDVDARWPWMRLRGAAVAAPAVEQSPLELPDVEGADRWIVEAANPDLATEFITGELLAWLERGGFDLQLETTPQHLLVAVDGHVPDERLPELVALCEGIVDHVPAAVRAAVAPPRPEDDL